MQSVKNYYLIEFTPDKIWNSNLFKPYIQKNENRNTMERISEIKYNRSCHLPLLIKVCGTLIGYIRRRDSYIYISRRFKC